VGNEEGGEVLLRVIAIVRNDLGILKVEHRQLLLGVL
jgi:hypothetical protein